MKTQRLAVVLTMVNLALLLLSAGWTGRAVSQTVEPVLRGRSLELVGEDGVIRTRLEVKPEGSVLLQLFDENGIIRVKLGAGEHGSGLWLSDETNATGIQLIASQNPPPDQPATTRIRLSGPRGARLITPCRLAQHCERPRS
jgi:hypothetical protein